MGQQAFKSWTSLDIPNMTGKVVVITGTNTGLGYHTALEIAMKGARVICVCRDPQRGKESITRMQEELNKSPTTAGSVELVVGDLSSLNSVKSAAQQIATKVPEGIDILVNNAGVMMLPKHEASPDGFEMQIATNHLGHFALTGHLLPLLQKAKEPRVVNVSSTAAWAGNFKPGVDLKLEGAKYGPIVAYGNSKLANLLFTRELARRYPGLTVIASHPGASSTDLTRHDTGAAKIKFLFQSAFKGALPSLRAATEPGLQSGRYFGPWLGTHGVPTNSNALWPPQAKNDDMAKDLWEASVKATKVEY